MSERNYTEEAWAGYEDQVLRFHDPVPGPEQLLDLQRAFIAGVSSVIRTARCSGFHMPHALRTLLMQEVMAYTTKIMSGGELQ